MKILPVNWRFLLLTVLITSGLFGVGVYRLDIDTDIIGSLPKTDPVISDATYLLLNHPMQNQVVVDVVTQEGRFGRFGRVRQTGRNTVKGERVIQKCRYGRCSGAYARSAGLCIREPADPLYRRGVAGSTSTAAEARRNSRTAGTDPRKFAGTGKHRPGSADFKRPFEFQGPCSVAIVSPGSSHRRPHLPGQPIVGRQPAPARHCQPDRFEHGDRFCRFDHGADEPD